MEDTIIPAIEVFISYAHEDEIMRRQLEKHLSSMKRQGQIVGWHDNNITAGKEWEREINVHLNNAHIILLLISADFMDSDYCYGTEMKRALERHEAREALVIPIILRPVHWEDAPFSKLNALPTHGKPVTRWRNRDEAFLDIAKGVRNVITTISKTLSLDLSNKSYPKTIKSKQLCANCGTPVSLPMFCLKCGLPTIQVCNTCGEKNSLERDTCQRCEARLVQVCAHCSEKSGLDAYACWNCGVPLGQTCYECEEMNSLERDTCQRCGVPLVQVCAHCSEKNSLDAELCLKCGMPLVQICIRCGAYNAITDKNCWRCSLTLSN